MKIFFLLLCLLSTSVFAAQPVSLYDASGVAINTTAGALPVSGSVTATNASIAPTASPVPTSATYVGVNSGGNLVGLQAGQQTMANSLSVAISSNQSNLSVTQVGRSTANASVRNVYSGNNVTTSAWVQLVASTANAVSMICVFDSSGQTLQLGTGAVGFETALVNIFPGGNGCEPVKISASTRVAIESLSATANTGELDINFYQ